MPRLLPPHATVPALPPDAVGLRVETVPMPPTPTYAGSEPACVCDEAPPRPMMRPSEALAPLVDRASAANAGRSCVSGVQRQASPADGRFSLVAAPATPTVSRIPPMTVQRATLIRSITSLSR
jgi:hypothetical protein